jgi:hypothetical protein
VAGKRIQSFYLSDELVDQIQLLKFRVKADPTLLSTLGISEAPSSEDLRPDQRGLFSADYAEIQRLSGSALKGDALLEYVWLRCPAKAAKDYYALVLRKNRSKKPSKITASSIVQAILTQSLSTMTVGKAAQDAIVESRGRKIRNAGKTAK